jgi:hypothetical protein
MLESSAKPIAGNNIKGHQQVKINSKRFIFIP